MRRTTVYSLVFFALFAAYSLNVKWWLAREGGGEVSPSRGTDAPEFSLTTLDGATVDLRETTEQNHIVVVNFWATWCGSCRLELPQLDRAYAELREDGLEILALSKESPEVLREYFAEKPVEFPVLLDTGGGVAELYEVEALPTTVVLDGEGKVLSVHRGLQPGFGHRLRAMVELRSDG